MNCRRISKFLILMLPLLLLQIVAVSAVNAKLNSGDIDSLRNDLKKKGATFTIGENGATGRDLTELGGLKPPKDWQLAAPFNDIPLQAAPPAYFNWCDSGGCPAVKDQGSCGSCWAFATVGPLEANILIQDGVEEDLSEQYLNSCNTDGWGCVGGWWAHDYHQWKYNPPQTEAGAVPEGEFPYTATDSACTAFALSHPWKIDDWAYIGTPTSIPSVEAIKQAILDYGPVAAGIHIGPAFQAYTGGVFNVNEYGTVNHAVVLVGWDDSLGTNGVWILRNSWGIHWGESGYMKIEYGTSQVGYSANYVVYAGQGPGFHISVEDSASLYACSPDTVTALLNIEIETVQGFSDSVTLTAIGLPSGVSASFLPNPVTPPASSLMTLVVDGSVPEGSYDFQVHGEGGGLSDDLTLTLFVSQSPLEAPTLTMPTDGYENGGVENIYFSWLPVTGALNYRLQVDTETDFASPAVDIPSIAATSYLLAGPLTQGQSYYWRVRAENGCGEGLFAIPFSFVANPQSILLVDDDDNQPDVRPYYESSLNSLGQTYNIWDTNNSDNEPLFTDLTAYSLVIWFTGASYSPFAGPSTESETILGNYLNNGGKLFISSQDYYYSRGLTQFMQNYLGVASIQDDRGLYSSVTGLNDFASTGSFALNYSFRDYSDIVVPGSGNVAYQGDNLNDAALYTSNTVFFTFPWEAATHNLSETLTSSEGNQLMYAVVTYLFSTTVIQPCKCDLDHDSDCDGTDWLLFSQDWNADCASLQITCACDLDADDDCDGSDWLLFSGDWGRDDCP